MTQESKKNDRLDNKPRWELLPLNLLGYVVEFIPPGQRNTDRISGRTFLTVTIVIKPLFSVTWWPMKAAKFETQKPDAITLHKWFGTLSLCCISH